MNQTKRAALAILALLAAAAAQAATSREEATRQRVKNAAAFVKAHGVEAACREFADPAKGYLGGDTYVYLHDMRAKMLCNPANPKMNGKDLLEMKDIDGRAFNKEMVQIARAAGGGWLHYRWPHPVSKAFQPKSSYVERVNDVIVGSGFYN